MYHHLKRPVMGVEGWRCPFLIRLLSIKTPPGMMCYVQDFKIHSNKKSTYNF